LVFFPVRICFGFRISDLQVIRLESQHELAFPREAVWPVLSRTDWLNRSLGLPAVDYRLEPRAEGGSQPTARARAFGQELRWLELPFEWCAS
jgi:hypothetical protein